MEVRAGKIMKYLLDADYRFIIDANRGKHNSLSDAEFLKRRFAAEQKYPLDLDDPKTFSEKLQWLKLHDRNPRYSRLVDKYDVKRYVADVIGATHVIPNYGVWDSYDAIPFSQLPDSFVLKCTHDSGGLVICRDKALLNEDDRKRIEKALMRDYYFKGREWPYHDVPHRVLAEKLMLDSDGKVPKDYKLFCFNGKCRCFKVDLDRFSNHRANYYGMDLNLLPFGEKLFPPMRSRSGVIPESIHQMIELAEQLAKDIPFVRVDFYDIDGSVYFGEMTFYPASGFGRLTSYEWDMELGSWLQLPEA